jgi:hypothetical protein
VAGLAKGRVGHHDHDAGDRPKHPGEGGRNELEVRDVSDAQQEDRGIEARRLKGRDEVEPAGIADEEAGISRPTLPGSPNQGGTTVDPGVVGASLLDKRRKDPLARAHVEDRFSSSQAEERERHRDRQALVVAAPALADPAVVPARDMIPTRISSRRSPSGTLLVPGHGRRTDTWAWPSLVSGRRSYPHPMGNGKGKPAVELQ